MTEPAHAWALLRTVQPRLVSSAVGKTPLDPRTPFGAGHSVTSPAHPEGEFLRLSADLYILQLQLERCSAIPLIQHQAECQISRIRWASLKAFGA